MSRHRLLALAAIVLGVLAAVAGVPYPSQKGASAVDVPALAREVAEEADHITAIELAAWIRERKTGLRIIDLRSAEAFGESHLPGAVRASLQSLVAMQFKAGDTIVLYSQGGAHAAQGWVFLRALGQPRVYFLSGGLDEWTAAVMNPLIPENPSSADRRVAELSRYFGGVPRRGSAGDATPPSALRDLRRRGC